MTYIVKSSKNSNLHMVEPTATVKMDKWYTYTVLMLCMHFSKLSHGGYIYNINLYGSDDVRISMCTCMWCGDAYKDRVRFLISNRFVYTYYYVD